MSGLNLLNRHRPVWTTGEWLIASVLAVGILLSDGSRFLAGKAQLAFFDDDYYYYLGVARNLAQGHGSSFDGIHLTNGYHPLWMVVLWAVCLLPQSAWLPLTTLFVAVSAWLCFLIARRIFLLAPCDPLLVTAAAGWLSLMTMFINRGGMEIALTLPLLFWLVYLRLAERLQPEGRTAIAYGFLGALVILSRLDSILLLIPIYLLEVCRLASVDMKRVIPSAVRLLTGLLPIPLYLLANLKYFGTLTPVSGQAKQLEHHPAFAFGVIEHLFRLFPSALRMVVLFPACALILLAIAKLARLRMRVLPVHARPVVSCLVVFPVIHVLALASLSDWPLWQWYLYSWIAGGLGAMIILFQPTTTDQKTAPTVLAIGLRVGVTVLLLAVLLAYTTQRIRLAREKTGITFGIYDTAVQVASFSETHPGIYAMGDRAGIPGYLLSQPLIQTEGLVMDRPYLAHILRQEDLRKVLATYNVRYYIGSNLPRKDDCYLATEPAQGGSQSPRMKTSFCMKPVAVWNNVGGETEVFDLAADSGQTATEGLRSK